MYVYDFFKSLNLLERKNMPDINDIPNEDIFIFGNYTKEELEGYPIELSPEHKNYLIYSKINNITELKSFHIDEYLNYIEKLNNEELDLNIYEPAILKSALAEAILLLDFIASLDENPFFDAEFTIPLSYLDEYLETYNCDYLDVNDKFLGISLIKDVYFSQILYFIKKYVKIKLNTKPEEILNPITFQDFSGLIKARVTEYQKVDPFKISISSYTGEENSEFNNLIYQIELLADRQLEKRRKLSNL